MPPLAVVGGSKRGGLPSAFMNLGSSTQIVGGRTIPARTIGTANSVHSTWLSPYAPPDEAHPYRRTAGIHAPNAVRRRLPLASLCSIANQLGAAAIDS